LAYPSLVQKEVHLNETSGQLISWFLLSPPRCLNDQDTQRNDVRGRTRTRSPANSLASQHSFSLVTTDILRPLV
jgi:hypothetical protein